MCVSTACGPVCHSGYQDHRKYHVGHTSSTVHVRCHWRPVIQGTVFFYYLPNKTGYK